jgi:tRNA-specific 2-thiouridylase
MNEKIKKIAVALSGGVDSSFALLKLKEEGHEVTGFTLKTHCFADDAAKKNIYKACTSLESVALISNLCEKMDIPYHIIQAEDIFGEAVIKNFISTYIDGKTPNPCVLCNKHVKWGFLRNKIREYGLEYLATGHYAKIFHNPQSDRYELIRDAGNIKDQTYMLWQLSQDELKHTFFPLQNFKKEEVRSLMQKYSLEISQKSDSQGICFVENRDYAAFIQSHAQMQQKTGEILDFEGKNLGTHQGYWNFTIGQRRGLGIAAAQPLYVLEILPVENRVIVGPWEKLFKNVVFANQVNFVKYPSLDKPLPVIAKVRYSQRDSAGILEQLDTDTIKVTFTDPKAEIAPGQSLVAYENDSLVAGGIITH